MEEKKEDALHPEAQFDAAFDAEPVQEPEASKEEGQLPSEETPERDAEENEQPAALSPDGKSEPDPVYATTFAIAGIPLTQPIMPEAVIALGCVPIAKYGTPSTVEIPDAVSEHLQYFDAVLLENHGALTYSDSLLNAYHKMESVEFYARLLWQTMQIGGPQELNKEQVEKLYEIRRQMGLSGKHPANLCPNAKAGKPSCHSCGGGCGAAKTEETPDADLVASITKKVMDQLGLN